MTNFTYKITDTGYEIYSDGELLITQYEPYIPHPELSYEENAKKQIEELTAKPPEEPQTLDSQVADLQEAVVELTYNQVLLQNGVTDAE